MKRFKTTLLATVLAAFLTGACRPAQTTPPAVSPLPPLSTPTETNTATPVFTSTPSFTPAPPRLVPEFEHIMIVIFENKEFGTVVGNPQMPYFNLLASSYTLLTSHYAIMHPSLPNYIALIGGDTFGITYTCVDCFINAPSLPDLIEASGRTWKTYQDDMPVPCFLGDTDRYFQKHNPFIYFDPIRLDRARCEQSIVPLTQLDEDIASDSLPNYIFVTPDICYSAHDCALELADGWLKALVEKMFPVFESTGKPYLLIVTWDEGQGDHGCCGLPEPAGGRIATILMSPQAKQNFQDATPYTHYSILKTISESWGLPYLGHAADTDNALIVAPWR